MISVWPQAIDAGAFPHQLPSPQASPRTENCKRKKELTMATTPRRPVNAMDAAEALFKPVKKPAAPAVERPAIPNTKEMVSIKIDSDVLAHFQEDGPGWQDRINDTLRAAMKAAD
jgi:uncharacterized protein (DUF4415 family)